jgi:CheY-like chemotaxis protein
VGAGTTFRVTLPAIAKPVEAAAEDRRAARPAGGKETILVVEDEAGVRNLIRTVLKRAGYEVLVASDGAEALRLSESHGGQIHLLLTDMVMPGTRGDDLAQRIAASRPNLRVLLVSGYTDQIIGELAADTAFLQKPFTPSTLAQAVRRTLES